MVDYLCEPRKEGNYSHRNYYRKEYSPRIFSRISLKGNCPDYSHNDCLSEIINWHTNVQNIYYNLILKPYAITKA